MHAGASHAMRLSALTSETLRDALHYRQKTVKQYRKMNPVIRHWYICAPDHSQPHVTLVIRHPWATLKPHWDLACARSVCTWLSGGKSVGNGQLVDNTMSKPVISSDNKFNWENFKIYKITSEQQKWWMIRPCPCTYVQLPVCLPVS